MAGPEECGYDFTAYRGMGSGGVNPAANEGSGPGASLQRGQQPAQNMLGPYSEGTKTLEAIWRISVLQGGILYERFYLDQSQTDIEWFCQRCDLCIAKKGLLGWSRVPFQQLQVGELMERVVINILGPFPTTYQGIFYVTVVMSYFTKWPEAYVVPTQEVVMVIGGKVHQAWDII